MTCATCTMPRNDQHHDPTYQMAREPWDIPSHDYEGIDPIIHIDDAALQRMADAAYWEAARAWLEYRNVAHLESTYTLTSERDLCDMLRASAESADDYYQRLCDETNRRAAATKGETR